MYGSTTGWPGRWVCRRSASARIRSPGGPNRSKRRLRSNRYAVKSSESPCVRKSWQAVASSTWFHVASARGSTEEKNGGSSSTTASTSSGRAAPIHAAMRPPEECPATMVCSPMTPAMKSANSSPRTGPLYRSGSQADPPCPGTSRVKTWKSRASAGSTGAQDHRSVLWPWSSRSGGPDAGPSAKRTQLPFTIVVRVTKPARSLRMRATGWWRRLRAVQRPAVVAAAAARTPAVPAVPRRIDVLIRSASDMLGPSRVGRGGGPSTSGYRTAGRGARISGPSPGRPTAATTSTCRIPRADPR